jgi:hypothetical protein
MRRSLRALTGSILLTASMVLAWPVGVERLEGWELLTLEPGAVYGAATAEELFDCLDDPEKPTFLSCPVADGPRWVGFWTGWDFIAASDLIAAIESTLGIDVTPDGAVRLVEALSAHPGGFELLALLVLGGAFGEVPTVGGLAAAPPGEAPPSQPESGGAEEPPSTVEGQSAAQEGGGGAAGPSALGEGGQNYRFVFRWSSVQGHFDGTITGNEGSWVYEGTSNSSWPPRLHEDGGTVTCVFDGDPDAEVPTGAWRMDCDVYWTGDATWTGEIWGETPPQRVDGILVPFKANGYGNSGGGWSPIEVLMKPCPPGAVC